MSTKPLQSLVGDRVEKAKYDEGSQSWLIQFKCGSTLNLECMWRLLEEGVITSTSDDHGHTFGRETPFDGEAALNEMVAHKILSVDAQVETGDVSLSLGDYFTLQILPTSAGYESWQFKEKNGQSIVAVGGQFHTYENA